MCARTSCYYRYSVRATFVHVPRDDDRSHMYICAASEVHLEGCRWSGCAQTYGLSAQVLARLTSLGTGLSGFASLQLRVRKARLNRSLFSKRGLERRAETTNVDNIKQSCLAVIDYSKIIVDQSFYAHVLIQPRGYGAAYETNLLPERCYISSAI